MRHCVPWNMLASLYFVKLTNQNGFFATVKLVRFVSRTNFLTSPRRNVQPDKMTFGVTHN